jgi:hypothetical protein
MAHLCKRSIECGEEIHAKSHDSLESPRGLKQAHGISVSFTVFSREISVITRTYLCEKHANILEQYNNFNNSAMKISFFSFWGVFIVFGVADLFWSVFTNNEIPFWQFFLLGMALAVIFVLFYFLFMFIGKTIFHVESLTKSFDVGKEGENTLVFYFRVPKNAETMASAYGFELSDPTGSTLGPEAKVEKCLMEMPIIALDKVPKSHYLYKANCEGDYINLMAVAEFIIDKGGHPSFGYHEEISLYERGGGIATHYYVYRIAESTWRVVEDSEFTD